MAWCAVGGAASLLLFVWLVSNGTFNPGQETFTSNFYDFQAKAFMHGKLAMPSSVLSIEGISIHGKSYMYFGPLPAMARVPLIALAPSLSGKLAGYSMCLAYLVAIVGISQMMWRVRGLAGRPDTLVPGERYVVALVSFGASAGSILLYLGCNTTIYQEAELWAVALAVLAMVVAFDLLAAPSLNGAIAMVALCFSVSMVRFVVALGVLSLALLVASAHLASRFRLIDRGPWHRVLRSSGLLVEQPAQTSGGLLVGGVVGSLFAYALLNYAKFQSAFGLPLRHQALVHDGLNPMYAKYALAHSSFNALRFLPTTVSWYLRPDALVVSRLFPFVNFPARISVIGSVEFAGLNPASSITATMPVLICLGAIGLVALGVPRRVVHSEDLTLSIFRFRPLFLAGLVGCLGTLTYAGIANRHMGDFYPALLCIAMVGGALLLRWVRGRRKLKIVVSMALVAGFLLSTWINLGLGLINQRVGRTSIPRAERVDFARFRISLFKSMFDGPVPQVTWGGPLPREGLLGALYVAGDCNALYQNKQGVWTALERTERAGHFRLIASIPRQPSRRTLPLLVSGSTPGSADIIGIRVLPNGRYEARYLSQQFGLYFTGHAWTTSRIEAIPRSGKIAFDVVLDASPHVELRLAQISVGGANLISEVIAVHANAVQTLGAMPASLLADPTLRNQVASVFPGSLQRLPTPAPVCRMLKS